MQLKHYVTFLALAIAVVRSLKYDDLIVAAGDQLEFLTDGSAYRTLTLSSYNATKLSALAYDATTQKLYFSDRHHHYGHIFSVSLGDESGRPVEDIVEKSNNETVESLAYDSVNKMLLWTDWLNRSIRRVKVAREHIHIEEKDGIEIVHFLETDAKPRGLVFDPCMRMLYWTNIYKSRPTIERSFLNGSRREILFQNDLFVPNALDLDVLEQRLYWADNLREDDYHNFHIERSFVNGSGREKIYRGMGQFIVSLTVGDDYVYWTDYHHKNLWALRKDGSSKSPMILRTYSRNPAMGVVIFRRQPLDCSACLSPDFHHGSSESKAEITAVILSVMGLVVMGFTITIIVWWSSVKRLLAVPNKNEGTFAFRNFQNCSSAVTMSEMIPTQKLTTSESTKEISGGNAILLMNDNDNDGGALLKYEF